MSRHAADGLPGTAAPNPAWAAGQGTPRRLAAPIPGIRHSFGGTIKKTLFLAASAAALLASAPGWAQQRPAGEGLSGAQFDQAYLQGMIQDHQKDLPGFEQEARGGQDTLVKTFAQNMVPAIQERLREAQVCIATCSGVVLPGRAPLRTPACKALRAQPSSSRPAPGPLGADHGISRCVSTPPDKEGA
jgi:hypothetical protein